MARAGPRSLARKLVPLEQAALLGRCGGGPSDLGVALADRPVEHLAKRSRRGGTEAGIVIVKIGVDDEAA